MVDANHALDKTDARDRMSKFADANEVMKAIQVPTGYKPTNPKDAVGIRKVPFTTLPMPVIAEVGLAMLEGARKYGRHNYRIGGVLASVYVDAANRHLIAWWEGEDIDPASGLSHITKAIASLVVMRDTMLRGQCVDDRPPVSATGWMEILNQAASDIIDRYPDAKEPFTQVKHGTRT